MIRSSIKEIKKAIRKNYPKPFDVSSYTDHERFESETFIVIKDFTDKKIAKFKYLPQDGAILAGFENCPRYREQYERSFPENHQPHHLHYYQQIFNIFHNNEIFKELISDDLTAFTVTSNMFRFEDTCIRNLKVKDDFKALASNGMMIASVLQHYITKDFELKERLRLRFEFQDFGALILYYDYTTDILHFGEAQFVNPNNFKNLKPPEPMNLMTPSNHISRLVSLMSFESDNLRLPPPMKAINDQKTYKIFGLNMNDSINTLDDLKNVFDQWMAEIGVLINKKASEFYKMDDTFEAESRNNVIDNFNLIKMTLI